MTVFESFFRVKNVDDTTGSCRSNSRIERKKEINRAII
ncbi:hypothetical protein DAT606_p0018 (plasmid) [Melissococcus plutonius]|nr:hypothetical protein DAT606_p0018 [Melissococcus plutonius]